MKITRREFTKGTAAAAGAAALGLASPAIAQSGPIRIGWLAALTGASSAPAIGFDRGVKFATETINAAGGVKGRKIEIITRDTQGDPTKAVNATQEMISQLKVDAVWGPTNSGESLAITPIMSRAKMPNIHPCVIDSLIDAQKFPNAFRLSPSNTQWDDAVRGYALKILKAKKVAVIGDTTGYGVTASNASVAGLKKDGADVVYHANIDATQPDLAPDMLRAKNAGAEAIVVWSISTGLDARLFNTRATMGWDVAFVGHPSMSSGDLKALLDYIFESLLGAGTKTRFRPHYFGYTEPSFEVDLSAKHLPKVNKEWIEIGGCGMVDPLVFETVGYDSTVWSGYAFGMGLERLAMTLYGIDDIRYFYQNDLRFLKQFA